MGPAPTNSAGSAFTLDACRDIHAIAEDVVAVDNISNIDTDAKVDLYYRDRVSFGHLSLHGHRTDYGIYGACELHKHAIAGRLNDTAIVLGNSGIDDFAAVPLKGRQGADLVNFHQPRIAYDVRRQYRRHAW
jgi:hypothetical protein